jgi:hypothetical protein
MEKVYSLKKRPCKICRRWFRPHPRVKDDQKTCGKTGCKREWHRRKCAEWNKKNGDYFKGIYLKRKINLEGVNDETGHQKQESLHTHFRLGLPWQEIQEAMGIKQRVIIDYIIHLLIRHVQEVIKAQFIVNTGQMAQLLTSALVFSRGDRGTTN